MSWSSGVKNITASVRGSRMIWMNSLRMIGMMRDSMVRPLSCTTACYLRDLCSKQLCGNRFFMRHRHLFEYHNAPLGAIHSDALASHDPGGRLMDADDG